MAVSPRSADFVCVAAVSNRSGKKSVLFNPRSLAIESLQHAIALDPEWREIAKTDTDFDLIRQDDRFQALLTE